MISDIYFMPKKVKKRGFPSDELLTKWSTFFVAAKKLSKILNNLDADKIN